METKSLQNHVPSLLNIFGRFWPHFGCRNAPQNDSKWHPDPPKIPARAPFYIPYHRVCKQGGLYCHHLLLQHAFGCVFTVLPPLLCTNILHTIGFVNRVCKTPLSRRLGRSPVESAAASLYAIATAARSNVIAIPLLYLPLQYKLLWQSPQHSLVYALGHTQHGGEPPYPPFTGPRKPHFASTR